jgi:enoyl-CoA hydratase/carnithine racemase
LAPAYATALRRYFTAERVRAPELRAAGVLQQLVADAELHSASLALATHIAAGPPSALRLMKANLNDAASSPDSGVRDRVLARGLQSNHATKWLGGPTAAGTAGLALRLSWLAGWRLQGFRAALDREAERLLRVDSAQQREAVTAFVQRRAPRYD